MVDTHPEWLGGPFLEEAEYLRESNEKAWSWEYLGEIAGTRGVFDGNVRDEALSLERI